MKLPKELQEEKYLRDGTGKKRTCSIIQCDKEAVRSLSEDKWEGYLKKAGLNYRENRKRKIYLCKNHYRESKKLRKEEEKYSQKKGFLRDASSSGRIR
jgi:hypothetical protein